MKKNKIESIEGIDPVQVECSYSPAKRRGPTPGKFSHIDGLVSSESAHHGTHPQSGNDVVMMNIQNNVNLNQQHGMHDLSSSSMTSGNALQDWQQQLLLHHQTPMGNVDMMNAVTSNSNLTGNSGATLSNLTQQQQQLAAAALMLAGSANSTVGGSSGGSMVGLAPTSNDQSAIQHHLNLLQQQIQQRQQQLLLAQQLQQQQVQAKHSFSNMDVASVEPSIQRRRVDEEKKVELPKSILTHTHMLDRGDPDGSRLRAYYRLSIDEMFRLPCTPSDEEYCNSTGRPLVGRHLAALSASRFAETALGAIVNNEITLAMELCNAVVHCLREAVEDQIDSSIVFEIAKAYFLLGVFRSIRGDMVRYFKYRRVALSYVAKLQDNSNSQSLLAAMSFLDAWAYMMYNANDKAIPDVDVSIPAMEQNLLQNAMSSTGNSDVEEKYGIKTGICDIACDPKNKNWIQGAPAVYLNNDAPLNARVLDAVSCAVRTCCDFANKRFATLAAENDSHLQSMENIIVETPTATAVLAHENELCSRNVILSAFALMQQDEANKRGHGKNEGQHVIISAMDAFLEDGEAESDRGFTDNQIQSLLSVCNSVIENPFLLHHAGPTYHMVTNAATLLCHLLNGLYAMKKKKRFGPMELTLFEEVFDSLVAIRKLLTIHRRKLPVRLRCHDLPRIPFDRYESNGSDHAEDDHPLIDLGETLLCCCRGCQGFVLMACSPCVAAERARAAASRLEVVAAQENEAIELGALTDFYGDIGSEFDFDDDALLGIFENLVST